MKKAIGIVLFAAVFSTYGEKHLVLNPYEGVDWSGKGHKANFHTHTTESDGSLTPQETIDAYQSRGYTILAITDHNKITWPWANWDRDPEQLGMYAIRGGEASNHHHTNAFFVDVDITSRSEVTTLDRIHNAGGLAQLNHPGRYSKSVDWYVEKYQTYDSLFSMEVYNQGDRYSGDRSLWDQVLSRVMPARPVWGTSNDDMHRSTHVGRNFQVLYVKDSELNESTVRQAMVAGSYYFCYAPTRDHSKVPRIDSVGGGSGRIVLHTATPADSIRWISEGEVVATGSELRFSQVEGLGTYVRGQLHGPEGYMAYTQPFGLAESSNISPVAAFTAAPDSGLAPLIVMLDASGSSDADGEISRYEWDMDNDGVIDTTGELVSWTFEQSGEYTIVLTVSDDAGAIGIDSARVKVRGVTAVAGAQRRNARMPEPVTARVIDGMLQVRCALQTPQPVRIAVYDAMGKTWYRTLRLMNPGVPHRIPLQTNQMARALLFVRVEVQGADHVLQVRHLN